MTFLPENLMLCTRWVIPCECAGEAVPGCHLPRACAATIRRVHCRPAPHGPRVRVPCLPHCTCQAATADNSPDRQIAPGACHLPRVPCERAILMRGWRCMPPLPGAARADLGCPAHRLWSAAMHACPPPELDDFSHHVPQSTTDCLLSNHPNRTVPQSSVASSCISGLFQLTPCGPDGRHNSRAVCILAGPRGQLCDPPSMTLAGAPVLAARMGP